MDTFPLVHQLQEQAYEPTDKVLLKLIQETPIFSLEHYDKISFR